MSFTRKRINLTISIATGTFGETGADTVTLTGLRVHAIIQATYGEAMPQAHIRVFGLPSTMLSQLTSIGLINSGVRYHNTVQLAAGDDEGGVSTIYSGGIDESREDFAGAPDSALDILTMAGLAASLKPVAPLSVRGQADVATIMQSLATQMGFAFENNGVQVQLANPYFPGTALAQAKACARAADINMTIDCGTLAIWPKFGSRAVLDGPPLISVATGLAGYPTFSSNGIRVRTLFNPRIKPGVDVRVQSTRQMACGIWRASSVTHYLETETPNGAWFTDVAAFPTYNT